MKCMCWLQAHKASFTGRPVSAAPAAIRPSRLSVRVRAEDVKEKAEQAKDKVQEKVGEVKDKAGQVAKKATGKVRQGQQSCIS